MTNRAEHPAPAIDIEELRAKLRKMTKSELRRFGRAARLRCLPTSRQDRGEPPAEKFMVQLKEARAELRRRREKKTVGK